MRSTASSRVSMATALAVALKSGPSHLVAQVLVEVPPGLLRDPVDVDMHDAAGLAVDDPLGESDEPVEEDAGIGETPFERDVGVLGHSGELADCRRFGSLAVLDGVDAGTESCAFREAPDGEAVDLDEEVVVPVRVHARHGFSSFWSTAGQLSSARSAPPSHMPMRTTMNSTGEAGRRPISTFRRPLRRSSEELLVSSIVT